MTNTISAQQNNSSFNKVLIQLLKQVFKKIKKTLDYLSIIDRLFFLWFSVNNTVRIVPMPIITSIWIARARTRGGSK